MFSFFDARSSALNFRRVSDYTDNADFWIRGYEVNDFRPQMEGLWKQIKPLYLQIHAYVRRKLREQYGSSVVSRRGPIPAHLMGKFERVITLL